MSHPETPLPYIVRKLSSSHDPYAVTHLETQDNHHFFWDQNDYDRWHNPQLGRHTLLIEAAGQAVGVICYEPIQGGLMVQHYAVPDNVAEVFDLTLEWLEAPAADTLLIRVHSGDDRMRAYAISRGLDFISEDELPQWAQQQPEWLRETKSFQWYGKMPDDE